MGIAFNVNKILYFKINRINQLYVALFLKKLIIVKFIKVQFYVKNARLVFILIKKVSVVLDIFKK